jgi:hypothetical protein
MKKNPGFEVRPLSSLAKIFADADLIDKTHHRASCLWGEIYSFQVAYRSKALLKGVKVEVLSHLNPFIHLREVGLVPSELPSTEFDDHVLRKTPGLYPDPLYEIPEEGLTACPEQWRGVWVTVCVPKSGSVGRHPISINFVSDGVSLGEASFSLEILPVKLPSQKLVHSSWFHTDCIATRYGVEVWSRAHWKLLEKYFRNAARHGINLLLTPVFTPPLDTKVGGERPTVQLVDVEKEGDRYRFNFSRLYRWTKLAESCGIRYFEISHLFTQWGAAHCPKIVASENGDLKKIFGWKDRAAGAKYRNFLDQFLPALVKFFDQKGLRRKVYFHVSDEPSKEHLDSFAQAASILKQHVKGFPIIDALSDTDFYDKGLVTRPIPASNHIEPFVKRGIKNLWTYYCVGQWNQVSNRFFCMPSARNRILGTQLYRYDLAGFLQWGYNFWYAQFSTREVDPFKETDAGRAFSSGDAFMVYPGKDGPIDSLRGEVFFEALQDQRALQLLEKLQGRAKTLALLERGLKERITMKKYPRDAEWLLKMRERLNRAILKASL